MPRPAVPGDAGRFGDEGQDGRDGDAHVADVATGPWGRATAVFSACRRWRYEVTRVWDPHAPRMAIVMLNPSTTDAVRIDPTVRRCLGFARAEGAGALSVTNCFAWRSADPRVLRHVADPVGRDDDRFVTAAARQADLVVAAWGVGGALHGRGTEVRRLLADLGAAVHVLGLTRDGHPAHPLYLPATAVPRPWGG